MSAEKCGESVRFVIVYNFQLPLLITSPRAAAMVEKIRRVYPKWDAQTERQVWLKAYGMGLLQGDDEE